jgi:uncharacterized membrane protein YdjX (TVP38/TMEM64 family)
MSDYHQKKPLPIKYDQQNSIWKIIKSPRLYLAIAILTLLLLLTISPLKLIFDSMFVIHYLQKHRCCIRTPFIIVYALLTVIGIPGTILTVAAGVVFGLWYGTLWTVIGATLGALGAFWTARYLLRNYIQRKFANNQMLTRFQAAVAQKPVSFVLAVRFAPISPFNVVNFLFGLTQIHWFPYTYATFIGIIPGTLVYTWLGTSGIQAVEGGSPTPLILALISLTLLSVIPLLVKSIRP